MFCKNCGIQNNNGERFCKNCGILLENVEMGQQANNVNNQSQEQANTMNNQNQQQINGVDTQFNQYNNVNGGLDPSYVNKAVNPNMKVWAILSIVIPVVALIWYWFIGLTPYLAILIAIVGFVFARKGQYSNKTLAIIGNVANGILVGMAIVIFVLQIINSLLA